MNSRGIVVAAALALTVAVSACAVKTGTVNGKPDIPLGGDTAKIKILLKRESGKCMARVLPSKMELEQGVDGALSWSIKQAPGSNCLPSGVDLQLTFATTNPTACATLRTTSGNKQKIECDLGTYSTNTVYKYDVRLVGTVTETLLDPEIEIVQF